MNVAIIATVVIQGVLTGLVYGLMALGLSVIFGVVRVVNFAHGEFAVVAMYAAYLLFVTLGFDPIVALLPIAAAFKAAGTAHGPELMQAVRATNIADHIMIGPPIRFDDKGQNVGIPSAVVQNRGRTPTVTLPADVATAAPVLPMPGWQGRT